MVRKNTKETEPPYLGIGTNRNAIAAAARDTGRNLTRTVDATGIIVQLYLPAAVGKKRPGTAKRRLKDLVRFVPADIIVIGIAKAYGLQKVNGMPPSASVIARKGVISTTTTASWLAVCQSAVRGKWITTSIGMMLPLWRSGPNLTIVILRGGMTDTKKRLTGAVIRN